MSPDDQSFYAAGDGELPAPRASDSNFLLSRILHQQRAALPEQKPCPGAADLVVRCLCIAGVIACGLASLAGMVLLHLFHQEVHAGVLVIAGVNAGVLAGLLASMGRR